MIDDNGNGREQQVSPAIRRFVYQAIEDEAGPTTARPQGPKKVGRRFFDTTLGKPIWWKGAVWVDATGATV